MKQITSTELTACMKIFSSLLLLFILSSQSYAVEIIQIKGNKVLLDLEDDTASLNQKIYLYNGSGKKIGLAQIIQIKKNRAIALMNKGSSNGAKKVELGEATEPSDNSQTNSEEASPKNKLSGVYRLNSIKVSALVTLPMNSMLTKQSDGVAPTPHEEDVAMSGSSFGISGSIDYPFRNIFIIRGVFGYEPFIASGTSNFVVCNGSTSCTANISYLSGGGYLRFNLTKSSKQAWLGLGMSGKFPISKSTSALNPDDVGFTTTYTFAGGLDYFISNSKFIPVSFEYQIFQSSSTVSANIMLLRAGYGWAF